MSLDTDIQTGRIGGTDDRFLFPELEDEAFLQAICEEIDGLSATEAVLKAADWNEAQHPRDSRGEFAVADTREAKIARIKELLPRAEELAKLSGLTTDEAKEYRKLSTELWSLRFDIAKPLDPSRIPSPAERQSTLPSDIVLTARNDLTKNKAVYTPLVDAVIGVWFNANTAVDEVMLGHNSKVSPEQLYDTFKDTREALRQHYGDTVPLFRATGVQKEKPTTNWASTREKAAEFGNIITTKNVPVENILAVNVGLSGRYEEFIVGNPPVSRIGKDASFEAKHPRDEHGEFASMSAEMERLKGERKRTSAAYDAIATRDKQMSEMDTKPTPNDSPEQKAFLAARDAYFAAQQNEHEYAKKFQPVYSKFREQEAADTEHAKRMDKYRADNAEFGAVQDKVKTAIAPVRNQLRDALHDQITRYVTKLETDMKAANWDLDKALPRPRGSMSKAAYRQATDARTSAQHWLEPVNRSCSMADPNTMKFKEEPAARAKTIAANAERLADESFAEYAHKLTGKITEEAKGREVVSVGHRGDGNVWGWSTLTAKLNDGTTIDFKTRQIINVSSLGKLFNQWPTRIAKSEEVEKSFDEAQHPRDAKGEFTAGPVEITEGDFSARYERVKSSTTGDFYQLRGWKYQDDGEWHRVTNRASKGIAGFPLFVDKEMGMFAELEAAHVRTGQSTSQHGLQDAITRYDAASDKEGRKQVAIDFFKHRENRSIVIGDFKVETEYDRKSRNWYTALRDSDGNAIDTDYSGTEAGAAVSHLWAIKEAIKKIS